MSTRSRRSKSSYDRLSARLRKQHTLDSVLALLHWDAETQMPPAAAALRGEQMAMLSSQSHKHFVSPLTRKLISAAEAQLDPADRDSDAAHIIRLARRDYDDSIRVPVKFVAEQAKLRTLSQHSWARAKAANDFAIFAPYLEQTLAHTRRFAEYLGYAEHPYDGLLQLFEPGASTQSVRRLFDELKDPLTALAQQAMRKSSAIDDSFLRQTFPVERQEVFCREVVTALGLTADRSHLAQSAHPFTAGLVTPFDVRITTRYMADSVRMSFLGAIHESGHAKYELGRNPAYVWTPLARADSAGIHESQSRLWENHVGRSLEFWTRWYPRLQELFPEQLKAVSLTDFHSALNKVSPSFVRVQSDELTYNLHIMLRFGLELDLLEGNLSVDKLPQAWDDRFEDMFGIRPPTQADGVLQDIHWSMGAIGYFPTYTLGNLIAAQLWETATHELPSLSNDISEGRYDGLTEWLRVNIHQHGRKYNASELIMRTTGRELSIQPFMSYATDKYRRLYGV